jgi:hypothetical protein
MRPTPTPTEIPTPTEVIVTPPIEVTQVVTEPPTPTPTVAASELQETLSVAIEKSETKVEPSLIESVLSTLLPFLFTDKPDYAPTEKAVISGKEFLPYSTYTIIISSSDNSPVSFSDTVTTTGTGTFEYTYQLDGTYRPNYAVEVKDGNGAVVAKTTFTDDIICSTDSDCGSGYRCNAQGVCEPIATPTPTCSDLFFTEYLEGPAGSANNKAVELYNPTGSNINLNGYKIEKYANGSGSASNVITLTSNILIAGGTYVVCNSNFVNPPRDIVCNHLSGNIDFNGDDAVVLRNPAGAIVDVIG